MFERPHIYQQEKVEMIWLHHNLSTTSLQGWAEAERENNGLTMSPSRPGDHSEDWHATKTYRGNWSGTQLYTDPTTKPSH